MLTLGFRVLSSCLLFISCHHNPSPQFGNGQNFDALIVQDMLPQLSMLRGMAMQDDAGSQSMVKLFDVHQLPREPASRFKAVFQERATWLLPDLQAYIEDLQVQHWAIDCDTDWAAPSAAVFCNTSLVNASLPEHAFKIAGCCRTYEAA